MPANVRSRRDRSRGLAAARARLSVRRIVAALLSLAALLGGASPGAADERVALVVGNAAYAGAARLGNTVPDARAVAAELRAAGFDRVTLVEDGTRLALEEALDDFSDRAAGAATALFYFAGHGVQIEGENYLVPVDVDLRHRRDVRRLLGLEEVLQEASRASALGLVVLDACRDNPFDERQAGALGRGLSRAGLAPVTTRSRGDTLVAYSTAANAIALDGTDGHSPYARAFLKHVATPGLDVRLMLGAVRDEVVAATRGEQVPHVYGSLGGATVALVPHGRARETAVATADDVGGRARLPDGRGLLLVDTVPDDATVRITNIAPAYDRGMALPLGREYDLMVSRAGYRAERLAVHLSRPETHLEVSLEPLVGARAPAPPERASEPARTPFGADAPAIDLVLRRRVNGLGEGASERDEAILRGAFARRGARVLAGDDAPADFRLPVTVSFTVDHSERFGLWSADCEASYEILDTSAGTSSAGAYVGRAGPEGGASSEQVIEACAAALMATLTTGLVETALAQIADASVGTR